MNRPLTQAASAALEKCPFCSGAVNHHTWAGFHYGDKGYKPKIESFECAAECGMKFDVMGDDITKEQAFAKFNTRALLTAAAQPADKYRPNEFGHCNFKDTLSFIEAEHNKAGSNSPMRVPAKYYAALRIALRQFIDRNEVPAQPATDTNGNCESRHPRTIDGRDDKHLDYMYAWKTDTTGEQLAMFKAVCFAFTKTDLPAAEIDGYLTTLRALLSKPTDVTVEKMVAALRLISEAPRMPYKHLAADRHNNKVFELTNYSVTKVAKQALADYESSLQPIEKA